MHNLIEFSQTNPSILTNWCISFIFPTFFSFDYQYWKKKHLNLFYLLIMLLYRAVMEHARVKICSKVKPATVLLSFPKSPLNPTKSAWRTSIYCVLLVAVVTQRSSKWSINLPRKSTPWRSLRRRLSRMKRLVTVVDFANYLNYKRNSYSIYFFCCCLRKMSLLPFELPHRKLTCLNRCYRKTITVK